ncbi:MAG: hypothetical protein ABMB14_28700 [Myxococcota bacterium]
MLQDPRRLAFAIAGRLGARTLRAVFRALVGGRDDEARARLGAVPWLPEGWDLADPVFREWLLEAVEYRISPPDLDEDDVTEPIAVRGVA